MKNLFMVLLVILSAVLAQQLYSGDAKLRASVEATCDASHQVINGQLEEACGQAQDAAHAEYICDSLAINAHCGAELK